MIGLEIATVFRDLGVDVTIIEISNRLLPTMDVEFSDALERILTDRGVHIYKESILEQISDADGGLKCRFVCQGQTRELQVEGVLMSVGRRPNTEGLFDSNVPIKLERGRIVVDEFFRTSVPGIYTR